MPAGAPTTSPLSISLLVLSLMPAGGLFGQADPETPPPPRSAFSESVSVEQVLVPVVVRSRSRFVDNLARDDFDLYVDGRPTAISSFERSSGAPVHTLVLQDLSGSMGGHPKLDLSREILGHLLQSGKPGDLYSLASFAASGVDVRPQPTADRATIEAWTASWKGFGRTAIHDAIARIPELISGDSAWRGAVLLITDGIDNASEIPAREARAMARLADVPVHVIALVGRARTPEPDEDWSSDPLQLLAWVTGGRFHSIEDPANVKTAAEEFMQELRSQYVLGFPTSGTGQARPRDIRVEVRGKRRQVSFRREYFGTRPGFAR